VNVNPLYTARELEHQLKDSGAEVIVIVENFAHVLEEVIADAGQAGDRHQHREMLGSRAAGRLRDPAPEEDGPGLVDPGSIALSKALAEGRKRKLEKVR